MKPNAKSKAIEQTIIKTMQGYPYEIQYTQYHLHARKIVAAYKHCQYRIYAVGGDGLIHEIVQEIVNTNNELVVLPAGTGNDFARSIHAKGSLATLLKQSLSLEATYIDVMKANDIYCINVLCCAFDSDIANHVHQYKKVKWISSGAQYFVVFLRRLQAFAFYDICVSKDSQIFYQKPVVLAAFCNGGYFGGGFKIGSRANINDGLLDMHLIEGVKKRNIPTYFLLLLLKRLDISKKSFYQQVESVDISTQQDINIDGEKYPQGKYHLEVIQKKIKVVIYTI